MSTIEPINAIDRLEQFKASVLEYEQSPRKIGGNSTSKPKDRQELRAVINTNIQWVRRRVIEAGCMKRITISPPPAVGGLLAKNLDPFELIFEAPYGYSVTPIIVDMIEQTIGHIRDIESSPSPAAEVPGMTSEVTKGFVFVAMPMIANDAALDDVLDAVKEACARCGLVAERVDEQQSNTRITDRVLQSIDRAEYVVVDLTHSRPNVYYEAGYAQGRGKTPVFIARTGTSLEFDLKDYPVIFFPNHRYLKEQLETRFRKLASDRTDGTTS
jgi:hypothetical protein